MTTHSPNDFETTLMELLLVAYADGERIEGVWHLDSVPGEIPDWTVTIERTATGTGGRPSDPT